MGRRNFAIELGNPESTSATAVGAITSAVDVADGHRWRITGAERRLVTEIAISDTLPSGPRIAACIELNEHVE